MSVSSLRPSAFISECCTKALYNTSNAYLWLRMTRGALVLWVGVFSVIFLRRHLFLFQWLSLVTVMLGVCVVGLSGTIFKEVEPESIPGLQVPKAVTTMKGNGDEELPETVTALLGVLLILFAQLFTAAQFVLEEKVMARYSVEPL